MRIREKGLVIHNLLLTEPCNQDEVMSLANELRRHIISQAYYPTGPTIFTYKKDERYRVGVTINTKAEIDDKDTMNFEEKIELTNCIYVRVIEDDIEDAYQKMYEYTEIKRLTITDGTFYNVLLDVYGEVVMDIYLQVQ